MMDVMVDAAHQIQVQKAGSPNAKVYFTQEQLTQLATLIAPTAGASPQDVLQAYEIGHRAIQENEERINRSSTAHELN